MQGNLVTASSFLRLKFRHSLRAATRSACKTYVGSRHQELGALD